MSKKNSPKKEKYKYKRIKMKDEWRYHYVGDSTWKIDNKGGTVDPEDDYIDRIDNTLQEEPVSPIPIIDMLDILPDRLKLITESYIFNGESMINIGKRIGLGRLRIWQLYKQAIVLLKDEYGDNEDFLKYLRERNS